MNNKSSWKDTSVVNQYLSGKRASIPYAKDQIQVMLHLLECNNKQIKSFVDLGAGDGILSQIIIEKYPDSRGFLIDFSEPMLNAARKRFKGKIESFFHFL